MKNGWMAATSFAACASLLAAGGAAHAQDRRTVTEPTLPPVCATLNAKLVAHPGSANGLDPADESKLDTERVQQGLDGCAPGHALELAAEGPRNAFLLGPVQLRTGVTLLVDKGVTVYGSRDPQVYEVSPGSCGKVDDQHAGCRTLIVADNAPGAGIMGDGVIDGRGGSRLLVNGKEAVKSWWDLANDARASGRQQVPRLIEMDHSDNFTLYRITLKNAANFHVTYHHGDGFTVWGLKIDTPRTARNTDGVDPSASSDITITQSYIRTGDDNVAIKGGDGPVTHMSVVHNHFYWGHGMSIGSETEGGVSAIRVTDLSLEGDDSALRIKSNPSRGGLVQDVVYDDICVRGSKAPIDMYTDYEYPGSATNLLPVYRDIVLRDVRISGGGRIQLSGFDTTHRIGIQFDGVVLLDAVSGYKFNIDHTDLLLGPGPVNFQLTGKDSTARGKPGKRTMPSCSAMFVPFPQ